MKFDQKELLGGGDLEFAKSGLGKTGYLYYPKTCAKENCAVQIVFGEGADPLQLAKNQIPLGSKNNIMSVFPSVEKNWRIASSKYNSNDPDADSDDFLTNSGL